MATPTAQDFLAGLSDDEEQEAFSADPTAAADFEKVIVSIQAQFVEAGDHT